MSLVAAPRIAWPAALLGGFGAASHRPRSSQQLLRHSPAVSRRRRSSIGVRQVAANQAAQQQSESDVEDRVPPGCARYSVQLSKPLGLILEEDKFGNIFVAEVVPGGNADRSGEVSKGDQLIATSGFIRTTEQKYQDNVVRGGEQIVRLNVRGEKFDTVMAAIGSHPGNFKVTLEFQRCS